MRINHNISSMATQSSLFKTQRSMSKNLEKLSTGLRINRASDDAAGLAVSENLRMQVRGSHQARKNSQDAIQMLNIADGALQEQASIMQRMRELAIQAKNDTYTQTERNYMGTEFEALVDELDRIAQVTNFNGMQIFADENDADTNTGDPKVQTNQSLLFADPTESVFGANDNSSSTYFNMMVGANYTAADAAALNAENAFDSTAENLITIQFGQMDSKALFVTDLSGAPTAFKTLLKGPAALGLNAFEHNGGALQTTNWGADLQEKLSNIVRLIDGDAPTSAGVVGGGTNATGLERINIQRADIGAMINRLESTVNNLMTNETNQQAAESQIRDVDFAYETAQFTKNQILSQSATSMLSQANMVPQGVLQLLG